LRWRLVAGAILAAGAAGITGGCLRLPAEPAAPAREPPAEQIALRDLDGRTVSLASYPGKILFLNFFSGT
jgi:hypothetical protein